MSRVVVLETRDYRGTLGLRHAGEVVEYSDEGVIEEFVKKGFVKKIEEHKSKTTELKHADSMSLKEEVE